MQRLAGVMAESENQKGEKRLVRKRGGWGVARHNGAGGVVRRGDGGCGSGARRLSGAIDIRPLRGDVTRQATRVFMAGPFRAPPSPWYMSDIELVTIWRNA